jgi:hypothetical protein
MKTKKMNLLCVLLFIASTLFSQKQNVYFELNKAVLTNEATALLDDFINEQKALDFPLITLNGYTDTLGDVSSNLALSEKRVDVVYNYLLAHSYPKAKLEKHFFGESKPRSISEQWKNRRVEICGIERLSPYSYFENAKVQKEYFSIDNHADTMIVGSKGTKIIIPARCFISSSGKKVKDVIFTMEEYYDKDEMLLNELTTITDNGDMLISGGMININATTPEGEECFISGQGGIQINFAEEENNPEMQLFTGFRDRNNVIWAAEPIAQPIPQGRIIIGNISQNKLKGRKWLVKDRFPTSVLNYLLRSLSYPEFVRTQQICGEVILSFQMDTRGKLRNVKIEKGLHPLIDLDIMRKLAEIPLQSPVIDRAEKAKKYVFECSIFYCLNECAKAGKQYELSKIYKNIEAYSPFDRENNSNQAGARARQWFSTMSLGLINCDRFYYPPRGKTDLLVRDTTDKIIDYKLVFASMKAVYPAQKVKEGFVFSDIPMGQNVMLVAVEYKEGDFALGLQNINIQALMVIDNLEMYPMSEEQILETLKANL